MLGGLELGTVGGLEDEPDAVWHVQVLGAVPAGAVELPYDALPLARADRFGEVGEDCLEQLLAH